MKIESSELSPRERSVSRTAVQALSMAAKRYPQTAYTGLTKSLQMEWQFVQRTIENIGGSFAPIEQAISKEFIPTLFDRTDFNDTDKQHLRNVFSLPVKEAGLAISNPTTTAETNFKSSTLITTHIVAALRGRTKFEHHKHVQISRQCRSELRQRKKTASEEKLNRILHPIDEFNTRLINRAKSTGAWLTVQPSSYNDTTLNMQEFRDAINIRYGLRPTDLPETCDGCNAKFSVRHAMSCMKGGNVNGRHNLIRDELGYLFSKAWCPGAVRDEPLINSCPSSTKTSSSESAPSATPSKTPSPKPTPTPTANTIPACCAPTSPPTPSEDIQKPNNEPSTDEISRDLRGDLLIYDLWQIGTTGIVDVRVTDTDAASYKKREPMKVLTSAEKEKKRKYLKRCLDNRRHFSPFVVSPDGLIGKEASMLLKRIAYKWSAKLDRPYSVISGVVNARMSIAIIRASHRTLRGSRVPAGRISRTRPVIEDGAAFIPSEW